MNSALVGVRKVNQIEECLLCLIMFNYIWKVNTKIYINCYAFCATVVKSSASGIKDDD